MKNEILIQHKISMYAVLAEDVNIYLFWKFLGNYVFSYTYFYTRFLCVGVIKTALLTDG